MDSVGIHSSKYWKSNQIDIRNIFHDDYQINTVEVISNKSFIDLEMTKQLGKKAPTLFFLLILLVLKFQTYDS